MEVIVNFIKDGFAYFSDLSMLISERKQYLIKVRGESVLSNAIRLTLYLAIFYFGLDVVRSVKLSHVFFDNAFQYVGLSLLDLAVVFVWILPYVIYLHKRKMRKAFRVALNSVIILKILSNLVVIGFLVGYELTESYFFYYIFALCVIAEVLAIPALFLVFFSAKRKLSRTILAYLLLLVGYCIIMGSVSIIVIDTLPDSLRKLGISPFRDSIAREQVEVGDRLVEFLKTSYADPVIINANDGDLRENAQDSVSSVRISLEKYDIALKKEEMEARYMRTKRLIDDFRASYLSLFEYNEALNNLVLAYRGLENRKDKLELALKYNEILKQKNNSDALLGVKTLNTIYHEANRRAKEFFLYSY